jgi:hypothetical protein
VIDVKGFECSLGEWRTAVWGSDMRVITDHLNIATVHQIGNTGDGDRNAALIAAAPDLAACVASLVANYPQLFDEEQDPRDTFTAEDAEGLLGWFEEQGWYWVKALKKAGLA